ncbi:MAG: mechanosensitive ion channel family protein [Bacilli bacterium]|nr:mechanosensitive ion channel family protein [Bacilli bacterium]
MVKTFFENVWMQRLVFSTLILIICVLLYIIIDDIFIKKIIGTKFKFFDGKRSKTYIKLIRNIIKYVLIIIAVILILQVNGINVSSMLAGVGIISIILGFAIQDALKDIIKGFTIISDSYYQVGDVIKYDNNTGKVLSIGLRTTKIEDIYTLNVVSVSNRNIEKVEIESHLINIDVPLSYDLKLNEAEAAIKYIVDKIKVINKVEKVEYRGVNQIADSSINYQIKVYCPPMDKVQIRRDSLRCILEGLEEKNIQVPYNQIDVHSK